ncbi:MAG: GNAT family N-acetyltransferase [Brachymonas sp.]|nr:GNAT family N-acetyltransferase [Brachymonas sp.]
MTPRIRLRPTMQSDSDFVVSLENDPANLPFITPWDRTQHEAAIRFPDMRHFVVEGGAGLEPVGFLILIGCRNPHQSIELKRMVIAAKGQGLGRAALRVAKRVAFDDLGAHRFWLDVKSRNLRAKALYDAEGFVMEGTLREAVRVATRSSSLPAGRESQAAQDFDSLHVLSMLKAEFLQRRADGLEAAA